MKKLLCVILLTLPFFVLSQENSVLLNGNWYKITVEETGIHKITYSDLANYGISVDEMDPRKIGLFGNKAGMLPESYDESFDKSLQQIAIQVVGESDGIFNPEDYILFYGQGPTSWDYDVSTKHFNHVMNWYSNSTAYFITIGNEPGKRIPLRQGSEEAHNKTIDTLDLLVYHENEFVNPAKSGKMWLGESFEDNNPFVVHFDLTEYDIYQNGHYLNTRLAANSNTSSNFEIKVNEGILKTIPIPHNYSYYHLYRENSFDTIFSFSESMLEFSYTYDFPNDSSIGWLDYLELNLKITPQFSGSQMGFRSSQNIGEGNISYYYLNAVSPENIIVWNVSDPLNVERIVLNEEADHVWFKIENDQLLEFQAFDGSEFYQAELSGWIENQNLHATNAVDFLIITHPDFLSQANQLAEFHEIEDGMTTGVYTTDQIYNEFSSGSQDISALRNFIWHMNEHSGENNQPKYVLLFGDASYDYKDITENNTNIVPTFTTLESANLVSSFASDRFFSVKNMPEPDEKQIAMGRMPTTSTEEADNVLQKIYNYSSNQSLGSWKNEMMFIADDADMGLHQTDANTLTIIADTNNPVVNINKCYLDFFELIETDEGHRYPEVNQEIEDKVNEGVYYVNYTGHGGVDQLAEERILTKEDLENWTNSDKLGLWVIASSDVAKYTDPEFVSLGEALYLKENAGAIGLYCTSGIAYASYNFRFNRSLLQKLTDENLQGSVRFGDLMPSLQSGSQKDLKWTFFGDPALKINFPEHKIVTTKINNIPIEEYTDTISPGSILNIQGEILSKQDNSLQLGFNGRVYLKVFAPVYLRSTQGNQDVPIQEFEVQDSVLSIVEATVIDGFFDLQIALPNLDYTDYGNIKLSWYAENGISDANGFYNELIYGGLANSITDIDGILNQIKVYPTLFDEHLYIETPHSLHQDLNYKLFNSMGHIIYKNSYPSGAGLTKIELPNLAKGMYILNLYTSSSSKNFKLLKN